MNKTGRGPAQGPVGTQKRHHPGLESQETFQKKSNASNPEDGSGQVQWGTGRRKRYLTKKFPMELQHLQRPMETESLGFSRKGNKLYLKQRVHVEEGQRRRLGLKWTS